MEVCLDTTDASGMSSDTDGVDFDLENDHPLELHAVINKSEMDATINKITNDLDRSILANKLGVNPKYAVMDIRGLKSEELPQNLMDTERYITTPLTRSDYDI